MPAEDTKTAWLTVIGIGEDGVAGLGDVAKRIIAEAEFVFGGARHLQLAAGLTTGEIRAWPTPFDPRMRAVTALRGRKVCVLATGDPFHFGVGATLSHLMPACEMQTIPAPSAFSLAASRLGWPLQEIDTVSLHGRSIDLIRPLLHQGRRIIALTSDGAAPAAVAALLARLGFGRSRLSVLEALGGPAEIIRETSAENFCLENINPVNVLAVTVDAVPQARILPLTPGMPDDLFEHDGQITKSRIRAVTLSALAPRRGELLWDVGAGSGSVSIEWMLADPSLRAVAIESDPERAGRARSNAAACGVPGLQVIEGTAPAALAGLDAPDAVFIGGGGSDPGVLDVAIAALKPGGRLVANAVTLEMEAMLLSRQAALGGELVRLAFSRAAPVGTMTGWRPAMPVTQWTWEKQQ